MHHNAIMRHPKKSGLELWITTGEQSFQPSKYCKITTGYQKKKKKIIPATHTKVHQLPTITLHGGAVCMYIRISYQQLPQPCKHSGVHRNQLPTITLAGWAVCIHTSESVISSCPSQTGIADVHRNQLPTTTSAGWAVCSCPSQTGIADVHHNQLPTTTSVGWTVCSCPSQTGIADVHRNQLPTTTSVGWAVHQNQLLATALAR